MAEWSERDLGRGSAGRIARRVGLLALAVSASSCQFVSGLDDYELVATAWQKSWGGTGSELVTAVAVDADDNVLLAGGFNSTVSFGGAPLNASGELDAFLVKLDVSGNHIWSQSFVSNAVALPFASVVTPAGNIAVAGLFTGTLDLGGKVVDAGDSGAVFVAQLGSDGKPQWGVSFSGYDVATLTTFDRAPALAVDSSGDLVVRMRVTDPLSVFDEQLVPAGVDDFALVRISPSGSKRWVRHVTSSPGQFANFVPALRPPLGIDALGRIVVAGHFRSTFEVDSVLLTAQTLLDVFVARFQADGSLVDARAFGGNDGQYATALAVDKSGNVLVTGAYFGELNIDGEIFPKLSADGADVFLSTFSSNQLGHLHTSTFAAETSGEAPVSAYVVSLDVDDNEDVLMTGAVGGTIAFGDSTLIALGGNDMFFAKLDRHGTPIVATRYGGVNEDTAFDGVLDGRGHVVVGGSFFGQMKVGIDTLVSNGLSDAFVIKWVP